ncbi:Large subunit ribosomal protein L40e [Heracleum sosnowskyi]|uniref:Large subunit ribosomal protein L40e n=1 Tax=Heracleum sosnowskyi TaxID=360622 RepID=A0AAD8GUE4_9APIA|nr:Large subunit ribosomal protein L40e [Heracleum sosnowskyi]
MQIFVKSVSGNESLSVNVGSDESIELLKGLIVKKALGGVGDAEEMRLGFAGMELVDGCVVGDYSIQRGSTLDLLMGLRGGGKGGLPKNVDPNLIVLAQKSNQKKKICRKCYARLDPRAKNCRKKKCGHSNQLRAKSVLNTKGPLG